MLKAIQKQAELTIDSQQLTHTDRQANKQADTGAQNVQKTHNG